MASDDVDRHPQEGAEALAGETDLGILSGRRWRCALAPDELTAGRLRRRLPIDFQVSDHLLDILAARGLRDAAALEQFFYPSLDQLPDPYLLPEMDRAVARLMQAVRNREKVAVHGDFDVDGMTGAALLVILLEQLTGGAHGVVLQPVFIPDRTRDGYGVAARMIREWAAAGVSLLITIDTGAAAHAEMNLARDLGLDVIVLDHHIYGERPDVTALVNPQHPDSRYPHDNLCGVAVAFKLMQALRSCESVGLPAGCEESVLDLVALGLIADQMPMIGEARTLVRKGMSRMEDRRSLRPGLAALFAISGLDHGLPLGAADLAYQVVPRLNACGRIGRVMTAMELLLTNDPAQAQLLAQEADRTNKLRRQADQALKEDAVRMVEPYLEQGDRGLVLASTEWHKGIIGIGASRLVERFHVPAVLIAVEGEEARGSARSVTGIDIKAVLDHCAGLLRRYGGHAQAAGMTLRTRDIDAFRLAFLEALKMQPQKGPLPKAYDLELPLVAMTASDVAALVGEIEQLEPFGVGNRRPVFRCDGLRMLRPPTPLGNGTHLRFSFRGENAGPAAAGALGREFVAFGSTENWRRWLVRQAITEADALLWRWDILFQISRNTYRPHGDFYDPVQQFLVDLKAAGRL
jgi:single-stranded-DNA-specific exonuclease